MHFSVDRKVERIEKPIRILILLLFSDIPSKIFRHYVFPLKNCPIFFVLSFLVDIFLCKLFSFVIQCTLESSDMVLSKHVYRLQVQTHRIYCCSCCLDPSPNSIWKSPDRSRRSLDIYSGLRNVCSSQNTLYC